jgi:CBS-domain-containing membrane protein
VDARGRVSGILTREDLAAIPAGGLQAQSRVRVGTLLKTRRMPRLRPDTPLFGVAAAMLDAGCDAVPILSDDGALVGLVTCTDVLRAVAGRTADAGERTEVRATLFRLEPVLPSDGAA